jgi:ABC-type phosphate transport system permease subunit
VTPPEPRRRQAPPGRSRRDLVGRVVLLVVALALAFLLGVAFARTLDERPKSSGTQTIVRTLEPRPQDAPARTVTVTVTGP